MFDVRCYSYILRYYYYYITHTHILLYLILYFSFLCSLSFPSNVLFSPSSYSSSITFPHSLLPHLNFKSRSSCREFKTHIYILEVCLCFHGWKGIDGGWLSLSMCIGFRPVLLRYWNPVRGVELFLLFEIDNWKIF